MPYCIAFKADKGEDKVGSDLGKTLILMNIISQKRAIFRVIRPFLLLKSRV
jgi:hypothetical protein